MPVSPNLRRYFFNNARSTDSLDKIWIESRYTAKTNSNKVDSLSEFLEKCLPFHLQKRRNSVSSREHYKTHACIPVIDEQLDVFGKQCRFTRSQSFAPKLQVLPRNATPLDIWQSTTHVIREVLKVEVNLLQLIKWYEEANRREIKTLSQLLGLPGE
jgi:hypothetical protein